MIDQEMKLPFADRPDGLDRTAWPADMAKTIAAIIAVTRSEWMSQGQASPALDEMETDRARIVHPQFGLALDAKQTGSILVADRTSNCLRCVTVAKPRTQRDDFVDSYDYREDDNADLSEDANLR
jgi:hypothetical protein